MLPIIVALSYNRPKSLSRLLASIERADYTGIDRSIELIISIDRSQDEKLRESLLSIAEQFQWNYGSKVILERENRMGMRAHSLSCGDLILERSREALIFLEDDSYVAPSFFKFAIEAAKFANQYERIAGIGLYSFDFSEFTQQSFFPIDDGYDNYYIASATTWGVVWTKNQWETFKEWMKIHGESDITDSDKIPSVIQSWPRTSWKRYINKYLAAENKLFLFPRISLLSNFADAGSHFASDSGNFQVPLNLIKHKWNFSAPDNSLSVYDAFFELTPDSYRSLNPDLKSFDFESNIWELKRPSQIHAPHTLNFGDDKQKLRSYSCEMRPPELNVILNHPGKGLQLIPKSEGGGRSNSRKMQNKYFLILNKNYGLSRYLDVVYSMVVQKIKSILRYK